MAILNSLRSWNLFELPSSVKCYANTGGFGIDGGMSSAVGGSLVNKKQIHFLIIGDLSFFYDMMYWVIGMLIVIYEYYL